MAEREIIMNHINKPSGFNPMANSHHPQFSKHNHLAKPEQNHVNKTLEDISLSERSVVALKVVHQSISAKFSSVENFNNKNEINEPKANKSNIFDFELVAKNVMSFVNSSLNAAKSRGADINELQEMLGQARQGANDGIDEAIEELGELNVIDDELSEGIEKARNLINKGLDETEERLSNDSLTAPADSPSIISRAVEVNSNNFSSQTNSSDLSITTADGDIVSISFSALEASQSSENFSYYARQGSQEMNYQRSSASYSQMNFSFSVQGDLDNDELQAIQSLIKDISKIEKDFFSGDVNEAFNKALELGYDEEQLTSFNLELRQTKASYVSKVYSEVEKYNSNEELNSVVKPVLDFIGDFKEIQNNANKMLGQESKQFNKLLESVFNSQFDQNQKLLSQFNKFIEKLL